MSALLDHSGDIYRGAFYIIDNAGQCPSGVNESDFQHSTIEAHLQRHTYYQLTDKGKIRVDAEMMHDTIRGLYFYDQFSDAITKSAYACQSSEDHAYSFFHLGTDKLPPQTLASYGYEKSTFREDDLPKYAPLSLPKRSGVSSQHQHIQRSFWVIIQDIEATKAHRDHASYKYRDEVSRLDALAALIRDFSLNYLSRKGIIKPCTSKQLCKTFLDTWKSKKITGAANVSSPWASGSKGWKPSYLGSIEQSSAKLTLGECLRLYNPDQAVSLSTDLVHKVEDTVNVLRKHASGEANDGRLHDGANKVYSSNIHIGVGHVDETEDVVRESPGSTRKSVHNAQSGIQRATTSSDTPDKTSDALFSLSSSYAEASRSTVVDHKRKRLTSGTQSRGKRRREIEDTPSTTPTRDSQNNANDPAGISSWVAHNLGSRIAEDEPVNALKYSAAHPSAWNQPLRTAHRSHVPAGQTLTALNLNKLEHDLRDLYRKMSNASLQLLDSVGEVGEETMPLDSHPPVSTLELHVRCWGDEWPRIRAKLKYSKLFSVPDVAMSLKSAYLFDKILTRPVQQIQVTLDPEADFASGSIGDDNTMKRLCALIAQDSSFQECLNKHAAQLADGLWDAIRPHIKRLQIHAEDFGILNDGDLDSIRVRTFNPGVMDVLQDALRLRISLIGTDCGYSFTWPHSGQEFDPRTMQTNAGGSLDLKTKRTVAFTLFPGLEVTAVDLNDGQPEPVYKAVVKLYTPPAARLSSTA